MKKLFKNFKVNAEWAELIWKIFSLILILSGTTATAFLAKASKEISELGPFIWVIITIISAFLYTCMLYLISLSKKKTAEANELNIKANYLASLSIPKSTINPLSEHFIDQIIHIPDLYLPEVQLHKNKVFKRCKIVGPGAIAIFGGVIDSNKFHACGSFLVLPYDSYITGILVLENCTLENCEIIGITLLIQPHMIDTYKNMGAHIPDQFTHPT
ncbi:hypothetical protein [Acinetobacter pittii]|uniref:hypothetical protein n=1 Tax=Acinetobacter pittii TaxID=48296 RepID=UPI0009919E20|nr:hypothetical protein [Acinetobacter pittii]AQV16898.1 hypothetical protein BMU11_15390 [Acinetobacter pittii]